jgi:hypothetical protein
LKDQNGAPLALKDAVLKRADGSEVKQAEAFMRYLDTAGGAAVSLPTTYDVSSASVTKRAVCTNGC